MYSIRFLYFFNGLWFEFIEKISKMGREFPTTDPLIIPWQPYKPTTDPVITPWQPYNPTTGDFYYTTSDGTQANFVIQPTLMGSYT